MKIILILQCVLILLSLSFCKDNREEDNKKKTQAISLLAVQMQNANSTKSVATCSEANMSDKIRTLIDKYRENCIKDSDCLKVSQDIITGYQSWGKGCYFSLCDDGINSLNLVVFQSELVSLNQTYCQIKQAPTNCSDKNTACPALQLNLFCDTDKKCKYKYQNGIP